MIHMKKLVKKLLFKSGLMRVLHHVRNRDTCTVVMFHRVLPLDDPRWPGADEEWTVSLEDFKRCILFFKKYYNVIGLDSLSSCLHNGTSLPPRSLLITFDDGWSDTEEFAVPVLAELDVPFVVFVAGAAIGRKIPFLPEALRECWQLQVLPLDQLELIIRAHDIPIQIENFGDVFYATSEILDSLVMEVRRGAHPFVQDMEELAHAVLSETYSANPAMLSVEQLKKIVAAGGSIGGHGFSHAPLDQVLNYEEELRETKSILDVILKEEGTVVTSMSFPHGKYNELVVKRAMQAGYTLIFNSEPCHNIISKIMDNCFLGRINIPYSVINDRGFFSESNLAFWLISREKCAL